MAGLLQVPAFEHLGGIHQLRWLDESSRRFRYAHDDQTTCAQRQCHQSDRWVLCHPERGVSLPCSTVPLLHGLLRRQAEDDVLDHTGTRSPSSPLGPIPRPGATRWVLYAHGCICFDRVLLRGAVLSFYGQEGVAGGSRDGGGPNILCPRSCHMVRRTRGALGCPRWCRGCRVGRLGGLG